MTQGLFEDTGALGPSARERITGLAIGAAVTAGLLALVLGLGAWALEYRQFTLHHGRVQRLVEQHPSAERVMEGVLAEPDTWRVPTPPSDAALRAVVERCAAGPPEHVLRPHARFRDLRIFGVGGMVYFLYFDERGLLADAVVDTRRRGCDPSPKELP